MNILKFDDGEYNSNSYLVWEDTSNAAMMVDAGCPCHDLRQILSSRNLTLQCIILTHLHFDHLYFLDDIVKATGATVAIHNLDATGVKNASVNGSALFGEPRTFTSTPIPLGEGMMPNFEAFPIQILHTPGHSAGSICILTRDCLFSGDTLFKNGIGRTDLPGGNHAQILASIREKIFTLPENTKVYPGHGSPTTIAFEKNYNPFTKDIVEHDQN